ncbi:MAG: MATE family efflux transporter [Planctomycetota bacterium]|nr:MAG: MATE family efflux transporter [Planctomycetota bacterium]
MRSRLQEAFTQLRLAGPVIVVNLSMMGMMLVDSAVVGHLSTTAYAAVSIGLAWAWGGMAFGIGVMLSLDALVSQARGAGDEVGVSRALQRAVLLAALLAIAIAPLLWFTEPVLRALDQPPAVIEPASAYVRVLILAMLPAFVFSALRQTLQAMGHVRELVIAVLLANVLNYVLDRALTEGWWGLPELGVVGVAWSTVFCDVLMVGGVLFFARGLLLPRLWPLVPRVFNLRPLMRMLGLGLPIGFQLAVEAGAFNAVTFLVGRLGEVEVAGHRTALNLASTSFMVPLGLSTAVAVRVGHCIGEGRSAAARRAAGTGVGLAVFVMLCFAALFAWQPRALSLLLTDQSDVLAVAVSLMPYAAAFQLFDGLQVLCSGILRGAGDTRWPLIMNLVGYWLIAIPIGAWWVLRGGGGPTQLWITLGGALALVALGLLLRVRSRLAGDLRRIDLESA